MTSLDLLLAGEGVEILIVVGADLGVGDLDRRAQPIGIDEQVVDHPTLGHPKILLILAEELGDLRLGEGDLVAQLRRRQPEVANAGGLGLGLVFLHDLFVRDKQVVGHDRVDLLGQQIGPHPGFELLDGVAVGAQNLVVAILSHEAAVGELKSRDLGDVLDHLAVGDPKPHPIGLVENDLLGHQLVQHLHRQADLLSQLTVELLAIGLTIEVLGLAIASLELGVGDLELTDGGRGVRRRGATRLDAAEIGEDEEDENRDDEPEDPAQIFQIVTKRL